MKRSSNESTPTSLKTDATSPADCFQEVPTRTIKSDVTATLWGRAAGRCEFWGCNTPLWKSTVTQEKVNRAQKAHIYAFSPQGPRGRNRIPTAKLNDIDNLMLVCHGCHKKIDQHQDGGRYPASLLLQWKAAHERRVEIVTGVDATKKTHIVLYWANVGDHKSTLNFMDAAEALFPRRYPAEDRAILLGTNDSPITDRTPAFWHQESNSLRMHFERRVRERIASGEINHISLFALAPQPLLILLGSLMNGIANAEVFQRHREPQTWNWPTRSSPIQFILEEPKYRNGKPVLLLSLSASVSDDRITNVIGEDASIWRVTVPRPNTNLIKSRAHLSAFRTFIQPLLDRIKQIHGQNTTLHIFPVVAVSIAVELGRMRMPKAHMPWQIYDQINALGGFIPALLLSAQD